jgi:NADPH:quinone reductase-like Zn-dependent oxidoreductase
VVQLALHLKLEVVATCSPKKREFVEGLGVKHVVAYDEDAAFERLKAAAPRCFDAAFEAISPDNAWQSFHLLHHSGILVSYGTHLRGKALLTQFRALLFEAVSAPSLRAHQKAAER